MNMQIFVKNHTTGDVIEFEQMEDVVCELEELREQAPDQEIEIVKIQTSVMEIPVTEENIQALNECSEERELEILLNFWKQVLGVYYTDSLIVAERELEKVQIYDYYGSDLMECFESFVHDYFEQFGDLNQFPIDVMYYFDYQKYFNDFKTNGNHVFALSSGFAFVMKRDC